MPSNTPKAAPGFYPHKDYPGALRYWDGSRWTDKVAPLPEKREGGPSAGAVFVGVLLAGIVLILGSWWVYSLATANDELDCARRRMRSGRWTGCRRRTAADPPLSPPGGTMQASGPPPLW